MGQKFENIKVIYTDYHSLVVSWMCYDNGDGTKTEKYAASHRGPDFPGDSLHHVTKKVLSKIEESQGGAESATYGKDDLVQITQGRDKCQYYGEAAKDQSQQQEAGAQADQGNQE